MANTIRQVFGHIFAAVAVMNSKSSYFAFPYSFEYMRDLVGGLLECKAHDLSFVIWSEKSIS